MGHPDALGIVALVAIAIAVTILAVYLVKKPVLTIGAKLWLFVGLGIFPAIAAASSTVSGMEETTHREFCGSCHVMTAHYEDALDPNSQSLAARHTRNPMFGGRSCYVCHADYGMYGYAMTKAGGMRHVYEYYLGGYHSMPLEEAKKEIHIRKPYDNTNCRQCHTTRGSDWHRVPEHESLRAELDANKVSCASAGCHGYAHPFTKATDGLTPPAGATSQPSTSASASATGSARAAPSAGSAAPPASAPPRPEMPH